MRANFIERSTKNLYKFKILFQEILVKHSEGKNADSFWPLDCVSCLQDEVSKIPQLKDDLTFAEIWEPSTIRSSNNSTIKYRIQNQIEMKNIRYYDDTAQPPISGFVYTSLTLQYLRYL